MNRIAYNGGYKYQLKKKYTLRIPIIPKKGIKTDYILLSKSSDLEIRKGYAWDGPSGPTIDTSNFMRGSLIHDALYQLMLENYLNHRIYREEADRILKQACIDDGMWPVRAWWVYQVVRLFADFAADPADKRPITYSPKSIKLSDDDLQKIKKSDFYDKAM
jgi:hypothetical protein